MPARLCLTGPMTASTHRGCKAMALAPGCWRISCWYQRTRYVNRNLMSVRCYLINLRLSSGRVIPSSVIIDFGILFWIYHH